MQGVLGLFGQILRGGRGHDKDSNLYSNPWSKTSWESSMTNTTNDETRLRSSEIFVHQRYYMCCDRWHIKCHKRCSKVSTTAINACISTSDHGQADSLKYTWIFLISATALTILATRSISESTDVAHTAFFNAF